MAITLTAPTMQTAHVATPGPSTQLQYFVAAAPHALRYRLLIVDTQANASIEKLDPATWEWRELWALAKNSTSTGLVSSTSDDAAAKVASWQPMLDSLAATGSMILTAIETTP